MHNSATLSCIIQNLLVALQEWCKKAMLLRHDFQSAELEREIVCDEDSGRWVS